MDNIIEPSDNFDFTKLSLAHPVGIQGGAYFTKIEYNKKPLYIQTCKSLTRQGFVKTGKKYYCDLMFDKNAETLVNWFEKLEERCQKLIFEKTDLWFQNSLEEADIENAFSSVMRIYKSGKYYLVRTNLKNNHATNTPVVKIYNEHEVSMNMEDITNETNIISILEVQGIKFTSRNFQIELELKQVMVLDNEPLFESCLIKTNKRLDSGNNDSDNNTNEENTLDSKIQIQTDSLDISYSNSETRENNENNEENENNRDQPVSSSEALSELKLDDLLLEGSIEELDNEKVALPNIDSICEDNKSDDIYESAPESEITPLSLGIEIENLDEDIETLNNELLVVDNNELNLGLEMSSETMQLKKPNQVYFELYKEARKKAKSAKRSAILAYLEAKNIKKTYMLENLNDSGSDSDFDAEIDEVSESELDGL